jgi:hypothetical protein
MVQPGPGQGIPAPAQNPLCLDTSMCPYTIRAF